MPFTETVTNENSKKKTSNARGRSRSNESATADAAMEEVAALGPAAAESLPEPMPSSASNEPGPANTSEDPTPAPCSCDRGTSGCAEWHRTEMEPCRIVAGFPTDAATETESTSDNEEPLTADLRTDQAPGNVQSLPGDGTADGLQMGAPESDPVKKEPEVSELPESAFGDPQANTLADVSQEKDSSTDEQDESKPAETPSPACSDNTNATTLTEPIAMKPSVGRAEGVSTLTLPRFSPLVDERVELATLTKFVPNHRSLLVPQADAKKKAKERRERCRDGYRDEARGVGRMPNIVLCDVNGEILVADGKEQIDGGRLVKGKTTINATIVSCTMKEAILIVAGANERHGENSSPEEKWAKVFYLLHCNELTETERTSIKGIAKAAKVSRQFVRRVQEFGTPLPPPKKTPGAKGDVADQESDAETDANQEENGTNLAVENDTTEEIGTNEEQSTECHSNSRYLDGLRIDPSKPVEMVKMKLSAKGGSTWEVEVEAQPKVGPRGLRPIHITHRIEQIEEGSHVRDENGSPCEVIGEWNLISNILHFDGVLRELVGNENPADSAAPAGKGVTP